VHSHSQPAYAICLPPELHNICFTYNQLKELLCSSLKRVSGPTGLSILEAGDKSFLVLYIAHMPNAPSYPCAPGSWCTIPGLVPPRNEIFEVLTTQKPNNYTAYNYCGRYKFVDNEPTQLSTEEWNALDHRVSLHLLSNVKA
jgi:hypothetical protein